MFRRNLAIVIARSEINVVCEENVLRVILIVIRIVLLSIVTMRIVFHHYKRLANCTDVDPTRMKMSVGIGE